MFPSLTVHLRTVLLSSLAGVVVHSARKRRNSQERGKRSGRLPLFILPIPILILTMTYLSLNFAVLVAVPLLKTVLIQLIPNLPLKFFLTVCLNLRARQGSHNLVLSLTLLRRMMNIKSSSTMLQVTVNLPLKTSLLQCKTIPSCTATMRIAPNISSNSTSTTRIMKVSDLINFAAIFVMLFCAFNYNVPLLIDAVSFILTLLSINNVAFTIYI